MPESETQITDEFSPHAVEAQLTEGGMSAVIALMEKTGYEREEIEAYILTNSGISGVPLGELKQVPTLKNYLQGLRDSAEKALSYIPEKTMNSIERNANLAVASMPFRGTRRLNITTEEAQRTARTILAKLSPKESEREETKRIVIFHKMNSDTAQSIQSDLNSGYKSLAEDRLETRRKVSLYTFALHLTDAKKTPGVKHLNPNLNVPLESAIDFLRLKALQSSGALPKST